MKRPAGGEAFDLAVRPYHFTFPQGWKVPAELSPSIAFVT